MFSITAVLVLLLPLYLSTFLVRLIRNYGIARKYRYPISVLPIHPNHLVWMITSGVMHPYFRRYLPYWIYSWIAPAIYGWEQLERRTVFRQKQTDSFMLVTCGRNELWTIDPEIVADVLRRPEVFRRTESMNKVLDTFGKSVMTSEDEAWTRQRKLLTAIINERISKVVFEETWRQSRQMVVDIEEARMSAGKPGVKETDSMYKSAFPAMKRIASNVLFRSAYGKAQDFKEPTNELEEAGAKKDSDMLDCIAVYIANIVPAAFIPKPVLMNWPSFIPGSRVMRELGSAVDQLPGHIEKQLADERRVLDQSSSDGTVRSNLMSMLVQASEYGIGEGGHSGHPKMAKDGKPQQKLFGNELTGNLLIFTIAGYETTANVLTFALMCLMAEPKWQDWLFEEIDSLFEQAGQGAHNADGDANQPVDYAAFHPKALRCSALMMEILRLYPPVVHLARSTQLGGPVSIETSKGTIELPPDTHLYIPLGALHVRPDVWRNLNSDDDTVANHSRPDKSIQDTLQEAHEKKQDEYQFRPSRWINKEPKQMPDGTMTRTLFQPPKGTFAAFSGGPRVCPGQKMGQVEFVCVILALLKDYRIEAVKNPGEDEKQVKQRLEQTLKDCRAEVTIVMNRINDVEVKFVKRTKA